MIIYILALLAAIATLIGHEAGMHGLYLAYWYYDIFMHMLGGVAIGLFVTAVIKSKYSWLQNKRRKIILIVFVAGFIWEMFEAYFNIAGYPLWSKAYLLDTAKDLLDDVIGGTIVAFFGHKKKINMDEGIKVSFMTGVGTVTGANFLVETKNSKILIDCGLVQGEKVAETENRETFPYDLSKIDALFITHAHLDHVGRIPKIVKDGYRGPIYSTPETKALAELVLNDAVGILAGEAKQDGTEPLYMMEDVQAAMPQWKTINYHEDFILNDDISVYLKDAGHILGSAMVEVTVTDLGYRSQDLVTANNTSPNPKSYIRNPRSCKILFTGDLGNSPAPLLRDTEEVGDADYLVMESVYGDRNHEDRANRTDEFVRIIKETVARGGTLVIPAFAIDRTQVLLYELNNLVEKNLIPAVPIFVDSPMAISATKIYKSSTNLFNDKVLEQIKKGDDVFKFPRLSFTMSQNESRDIEDMKGAKIILAGSGMSVGGRVIKHEAKYLPDEKNTILLVGYQSVGSLGRQLADGAKKVKIYRDEVKVRAHIETLYGYSAHKDGDHLVEFVQTGTDKLKEVFVVMGEPGTSMHLAQRINDDLGVKAIVPERLKQILLY